MTREEQLACLEDRPCSVCKFHTDRCNRWTCVFEDEPEEQEPCEDCITLRLEKGTLKYSSKNYVVYKKEWLKKWWQPELALLGIEIPSIQSTTKENLVVEDCISRAELLKAVDTWDKFGCDANNKLVRIKDCYVPYVHYDDVVKAIKGMPSIQPKTDVLDKIRAEIKEESRFCPLTEGLERALEIIDKYKAEKE